MWEMLEDINFECDECGGPGPPPKFMIPPPPRPPFMQELIKCKEDDLSSSSSSSSSGGGGGSIKSGSLSSSNSDINNINNWDSDICDAIPILDASYHSSPSLQTSAIIAVFSLLLVLVVLVSSLFVWKHKRKVQNFLPCKTPTRGPHIGGNISGGHSVTYEDPDAHLGHRPLVMRHHHNVEIMHHSKAIHYPSGYPMTRSPPLFVCSSPGPDPYRSNDNVYEELGPTHDSDIESEPGQQSDDDFAEDELSLPGERSLFNKSSPPEQPQQPVSTIYHERIPSTNLHERNTLLTSSGHSEPNRTTKNNRIINGITNANNSSSSSGGGGGSSGGILSGVFRHTTGRNKNLVIPNCKTNNRNGKYQNHNTLPYNIDSGGGDILVPPDCSTISHQQQQSSDILPPQIYEDPNSRNSLMTLAYNSNNSSNNINNNNNNFQVNGNTSCNNLNNNSSNNNNNNNNNRQQSQHCYNTLETEVERRNRINNQLHQPPLLTKQPPVATIFRGGDRINCTSRYPQPYYTHHQGLINNQSQQQQQQQQQFSRSRTNPRSLDRRRIITPPPPPPPSQVASGQIDETTYGYAEPVFHEGLLYNHHHNNLHLSTNNAILRQAYPSYILPDYTTGSYRTLGSNNNNNHQHNHQHHHHNHHHQQQHQPYHYPSIYNHNTQDLLQSQQTQHPQQLYSRDSSFGSDSGYSHNTQGSSLTGDIIGRGNCRNGNNSSNSNGIRTPTTPNLPLPITDTKYHGQQNYNNNMNNKNFINGSNFLWNRKIPPSVSSLSSQSTNNSISSSCNKDNNLLSQGTNITSTNTLTTITPTTNIDGTGIVNGGGSGGGGVEIVVDSGEELTATTMFNNCNNSKNSICNVNAQSNNSPNNNNLNANNQIMSNTSKSNSNNSLGSINNNSNLNCLSGSSGGSGNIVSGISNSTNNKT